MRPASFGLRLRDSPWRSSGLQPASIWFAAGNPSDTGAMALRETATWRSIAVSPGEPHCSDEEAAAARSLASGSAPLLAIARTSDSTSISASAAARNALVPYASAAFMSYRELEQHQRARTIAGHSSFVRPPPCWATASGAT